MDWGALRGVGLGSGAASLKRTGRLLADKTAWQWDRPSPVDGPSGYSLPGWDGGSPPHALRGSEDHRPGRLRHEGWAAGRDVRAARPAKCKLSRLCRDRLLL